MFLGAVAEDSKAQQSKKQILVGFFVQREMGFRAKPTGRLP